MTLFILAETSAGYAILKAKDKKLLKREDLAADTESVDGICSLLKLKQFQKFDSAATALEEVSALVDGKVTPMLASLLNSIKDEKKASLAVADPKLGIAINKLPNIDIKSISDSSTADLYRAIRSHLPSLIPGLLPQDISTMSLGLSHSLSRHKLKFSTDKVDTMIVQAISLLDDLDKELNTYAMRVKEWYGWHFPEMGKIVNDNLAYARVILHMGMRSNAVKTDLSEILPEEIETSVKAAAEVSMGTEITKDDLENIQALADQVVGFTEYRQQLSGYLSARMAAIAPNLTVLVGELVGARLIAHAGSLMNLAKSPASTIQILGAEKALFRALKTKHDTPKYGLIYHASLIGQATGKNKGKIARMLATKAAIGLRVDALSDWSAHGEGKGEDVTEEEKSALGVECRLKIEKRLRVLEGKPLSTKGVYIGPNGKFGTTPDKWELKETRKYNPDADGLTGEAPASIITKKEIKEKKLKKEDVDVKMQGLDDEGVESKEEDEEEDEEVVEKSSDIVMGGDDDHDEDEEEEEEEEEDDDDDDDEEEEAEAEKEEEDEDEVPSKKSRQSDGKKKSSSKASTTLPDSSPSHVQLKSSAKGKRVSSGVADLKAKQIADKIAAQKAKHEKKAARKAEKKRQRAVLSGRSKKEMEQDDVIATQLGMSLSRYRKKLSRGEILISEDGTPVAISKQEHKRIKKAAEKAEKKAEAESKDESGGRKRKRNDEEGESKEKKKKKRKE